MIGKTSAASVYLAILIAASGCATDPNVAAVGEESIRYGTVVQIDSVELEGDHQLGVGAILGAAAGGLIGSQIGHGFGRDVATVVGVLGGGFAGSTVQNHYVDKRRAQQITIRMRNGVLVSVTQPPNPDIRVGARVRIQGGGEHARVIRA
jgi:outer membrane lipoprotein SlyB